MSKHDLAMRQCPTCHATVASTYHGEDDCLRVRFDARIDALVAERDALRALLKEVRPYLPDDADGGRDFSMIHDIVRRIDAAIAPGKGTT